MVDYKTVSALLVIVVLQSIVIIQKCTFILLDFSLGASHFIPASLVFCHKGQIFTLFSQFNISFLNPS